MYTNDLSISQVIHKFYFISLNQSATKIFVLTNPLHNILIICIWSRIVLLCFSLQFQTNRKNRSIKLVRPLIFARSRNFIQKWFLSKHWNRFSLLFVLLHLKNCWNCIWCRRWSQNRNRFKSLPCSEWFTFSLFFWWKWNFIESVFHYILYINSKKMDDDVKFFIFSRILLKMMEVMMTNSKKPGRNNTMYFILSIIDDTKKIRETSRV